MTKQMINFDNEIYKRFHKIALEHFPSPNNSNYINRDAYNQALILFCFYYGGEDTIADLERELP